MFQQLNWDIQITVTINIIIICCIVPQHFATFLYFWSDVYIIIKIEIRKNFLFLFNLINKKQA